MTNIVPLVRAWLVADGGVTALCGPRVSSSLDTSDPYPAIVIGAVSGGPASIAAAQVHTIERWSVALYIFGGRLAGGSSDLPDTQSAWVCAQAVTAATASLDTSHFHGADGRIVSGRVMSAAPGIDFDTNSSRVTLTLELVVVRID